MIANLLRKSRSKKVNKLTFRGKKFPLKDQFIRKSKDPDWGKGHPRRNLQKKIKTTKGSDAPPELGFSVFEILANKTKKVNVRMNRIRKLVIW